MDKFVAQSVAAALAAAVTVATFVATDVEAAWQFARATQAHTQVVATQTVIVLGHRA